MKIQEMQNLTSDTLNQILKYHIDDYHFDQSYLNPELFMPNFFFLVCNDAFFLTLQDNVVSACPETGRGCRAWRARAAQACDVRRRMRVRWEDVAAEER